MPDTIDGVENHPLTWCYVNDEHKTIFLPVLKAGHITVKSMFNSMSDTEMLHASKIPGYKLCDYHVFSTIRHPVGRFVSTFLQFQNNNLTSPPKNWSNQFTHEADRLLMFIEDLEHSCRYNRHLLPQCDSWLPLLEHLDELVPTSGMKYSETLLKLATAAGMTEVPHHNAKAAEDKSRLMDILLSDPERDIITRICRLYAFDLYAYGQVMAGTMP